MNNWNQCVCLNITSSYRYQHRWFCLMVSYIISMLLLLPFFCYLLRADVRIILSKRKQHWDSCVNNSVVKIILFLFSGFNYTLFSCVPRLIIFSLSFSYLLAIFFCRSFFVCASSYINNENLLATTFPCEESFTTQFCINLSALCWPGYRPAMIGPADEKLKVSFDRILSIT